jgi:hypothetical protein
MISILYDTERCLDGLTLVDGFFRPLSARREPVRVVTADLDDPVVLQLLNARDDLLPFMSRYSAGAVYTPWGGAPDPMYEPNVHFSTIAGWQILLRQRVTEAGSSDQVAALVSLSDPHIRTAISFHLRDGRAQMLVRCDELFDFMRLEAAMIAIEGAKLVTCGCCGNYFAAGPATSRRTDAQYCSDKCRVAAMRARKKESK